MLGLLQIYKQGAGAANAKRVRIYGKTFEAFNAKLPLQAFHCGVIYKRPFVNGCGIKVPETVFKPFLVTPLDHKFTRFHGT